MQSGRDEKREEKAKEINRKRENRKIKNGRTAVEINRRKIDGS